MASCEKILPPTITKAKSCKAKTPDSFLIVGNERF